MPTNVRIEHADGTSTLCAIIYLGMVNGTHEWEAAAPCEILPTDQLVMDMLPAKTGVRMTIEREGTG